MNNLKINEGVVGIWLVFQLNMLIFAWILTALQQVIPNIPHVNIYPLNEQ